MLKFNQLYVNDGKLYINVSVLSGDQYRNVYIDTVRIDTQDTYNTDKGCVISTSGNPTIYTASLNIATEILNNTSGEPIEGLSDTALFFVTVTAGSTDDFAGLATSNCGEDVTTKIGVCMNLQPFYTIAMSYIKGMCKDNCNNICDKSYFVDYILKFEALELAAETSNYTTLIKLYNDFFRTITPTAVKGGCGCGH